MRSAIALVALAAASATATAETPPAETEIAREPRLNAVSLHLLSLDARALSVGYERFVLPPRISLLALGGVRDAAGGDYSGWTLSGGAAIRYWVTNFAPSSGLGPGNMVGLFVAAQLNLARTTLRDEVAGQSLSPTLTIAEQLTIGYRFAIRGRVEITPTTGLALRHDFVSGARLPAWTRGAAVFGLTIGGLF